MNVKDELRRLQAPDEAGAQARAWEVVRTARGERAPRVRRKRRWPLILGPGVTAAIMALTLTPAGATVGRVISHAVTGQPPTRPQLSLPAPGKLLLSGVGGTWIVAKDGTRTRIGPWHEASWSPHGRYIAVASRNELAAVTQRGAVKWRLWRPTVVTDPAWYSPSGYRVAYRSGRSLRVVAGDGTGDRLLAARTAPVAPAWQPDHPYRIAYVHNHHVVLRDADTGRVLWTRPAGRVITLDWSANGARLLVLTRSSAKILTADGRTAATTRGPQPGPGNPLLGGAISPNGRKIALVSRRELETTGVPAGSGPGSGGANAILGADVTGTGSREVTWSPNSRWLLISWPAADEWVFFATSGKPPRLTTALRIAQEFRQPRTAGLPRLDGWCCTSDTQTMSGQH